MGSMFMRSGGSIQLARIFGIRIGVHFSWFVVLFLFIFILSGTFQRALGGSPTQAYLTAVASAMLFFVSLIMHELGHALVARRLGIVISGIDLWLFGGVARMAGDTRSPGDEFKVAVAGPLVTLLIVAACIGGGLLATTPEGFGDALSLTREANLTPGLILLSWLASMNAIIFVFNLVPAFPLDGGRIARAIAWKLTGDRTRATRFAAALGQAFSWFLMLVGFAMVFDIPVLGIRGGSGSGLWFIVLGWFLGQAARGAVAQTVFTDRIGGVTVADIMDREPVAIPAELPLSRALEEYCLRYRWPWFPVVDERGRYLGLLHSPRLDGLQSAPGTDVVVRDVMDLADEGWKVPDSAPVEVLLGSEPLQRFGALSAVDANGVLSGVVTIDHLRRTLARTAPVAPPA